ALRLERAGDDEVLAAAVERDREVAGDLDVHLAAADPGAGPDGHARVPDDQVAQERILGRGQHASHRDERRVHDVEEERAVEPDDQVLPVELVDVEGAAIDVDGRGDDGRAVRPAQPGVAGRGEHDVAPVGGEQVVGDEA